MGLFCKYLLLGSKLDIFIEMQVFKLKNLSNISLKAHHYLQQMHIYKYINDDIHIFILQISPHETIDFLYIYSI